MLHIEHLAVNTVAVLLNLCQDVPHQVLVRLRDWIVDTHEMTSRHVVVNRQVESYEKRHSHRVLVGHLFQRHLGIVSERSGLGKASKRAAHKVHPSDELVALAQNHLLLGNCLDVALVVELVQSGVDELVPVDARNGASDDFVGRLGKRLIDALARIANEKEAVAPNVVELVDHGFRILRSTACRDGLKHCVDNVLECLFRLIQNVGEIDLESKLGHVGRLSGSHGHILGVDVVVLVHRVHR